MQIFTYSCLEALNIGSQNRVSNVRRPFNPSQHCSVVCHLKKTKNKPTRVYTQALSQRVLRKCSFWTWIPNAVVLCWQKSHRISTNMLWSITITPYYLCYPLWRHKTSGFDDGQAGLREHVYQLDFDLCRHYFLQKHNDAKVLGFYEHIQRACTFVRLCYWDE